MSKILLYLEANKNTLKKSSFELIAAANKIGGDIWGVMIGGNEDNLKTASEYGLTNAYIVNFDNENVYSSTQHSAILSRLISNKGFDTIFFSSDSKGFELAPQVATKINAGYISDCVALNNDGGNIVAHKPVYAGKALVKLKIDTDKKVFSLRPNLFTSVKNQVANINIEKYDAATNDSEAKVKVIEVQKGSQKLDVTEADIVVSGGRAMKGPENFNIIEDLATALGGAVGASQPVIDSGWRPHSDQVGQTGKTVSPNLYIACGISGAVQHLAGMSSSKIIVAINKDKDAPIFKIADYGLVGDLFEIVPKFTQKVKELKG